MNYLSNCVNTLLQIMLCQSMIIYVITRIEVYYSELL